MISERLLRRALILWALAMLAAGLLVSLNAAGAANWIWAAGAAPVIAALGLSIVRDLSAGRMGVDVIALMSMIAALALNANLAAAVVAVMYAGGTVLEDFAVARAERELKALSDRAPRIAHRRQDRAVEDIPAGDVRHGDIVLVRAGEILPVDGMLLSPAASLDEFGVDRRADPGRPQHGRGLEKRRGECRRDFRNESHGHGGRKHLCRDCSSRNGGANGESALHAHGR